MAQLSPLIQFTAGTPAVADDVNSNFSAIRNHINSASIDTENIAATLTSRAGGPILFLDQASQNEIAFSIQNSQTNTAMQILQSAPLAATKAVLKLRDTYAQTAGKAELWLELATGSTIPALLVEHGADVSMSLTKTQLNLFNNVVQVTPAGAVNAITINATNINTTGKITATAPVGDAIAVRLAGRSSDNVSVLDFTDNTKTIQYANIKGASTSLNYNVQTGSSHNFLVNDVIKGVINNDGVDGQYLKTVSVTESKIANNAVTDSKIAPLNYIQALNASNLVTGGPWTTLYTGTLTTTQARLLLIAFTKTLSNGSISSTGGFNPPNGIRIYITDANSNVYYSGVSDPFTSLSFGGNIGSYTGSGYSYVVNLPTANTYTIRFQWSAYGDYLTINGYSLLCQILH